MKIEFRIDFNKDFNLWLRTMQTNSYGVNWKEMFPPDFDLDKRTDEAYVRKYLLRKFYDNGLFEKNRQSKQQNIDSQEIKKNLEELSGKKITWTSVTAICTGCPRRPYNFPHYFYIRVFEVSKLVKQSIYHELFHFIFHEHYWQQFVKRGFSELAINDIKESLTILLNEILKKNHLPLDHGYSNHAKLRERILNYWHEKPVLDKVIEKLLDESNSSQ